MRRDRTYFVEQMIGRFGRERWNEHVKLLASAFNGIGIASLIGGFVAPLVNPTPPSLFAIPLLLAVGVMLHMVSHFILRYYRGKE